MLYNDITLHGNGLMKQVASYYTYSYIHCSMLACWLASYLVIKLLLLPTENNGQLHLNYQAIHNYAITTLQYNFLIM